MTILWVLAWCVLSIPLALILAPLMHKGGDSLGGGSTPAEGGAHPDDGPPLAPSQGVLQPDSLGGGPTPSEGEGRVRPGGVIRGESPLAASYPRQDVPRPNGFDGRYRITVRDGEPFQVGGRSTTNDNEVQP